MAGQQLILRGTVGAVIFKNEENGYCVLRLLCEDGTTATVVGTVPQPIVGERLTVTGHYSTHPSYGTQFDCEFLERTLPQTEGDILRYLAGRAVKGIGPVLASRIVARFGAQTLQILELEPERLASVPGISKAKALQMGENFRLQTGVRHLMEFFAAFGLPPELAVQTYRQCGEAARDMLRDDPYLLTQEPLNCPFQLADRFAMELGTAPQGPQRLDAGILHTLRLAMEAGHCFLTEERLIENTCKLLDAGEDPVLIRIEALESRGQVIRDFLKGRELIYLPQLHRAELYCRDRLLAHGAQTYPLPRNFKKLVSAAQAEAGIAYSDLQLRALEEAAAQGLLLLTGGPGTGKTTVLRGILEVWEGAGLRCLLAAPTGRAAKRLSEVTGREASTVHRLLEAGIDPFTGDMVFSRDEDAPLKCDALVVDEMSMVDVLLLHSLLRAVRPGTRLVLVGDPDQLPPVGPGCPFRDALGSGLLPAVRLTEIFRQAQKSLIVTNAHAINCGEAPQLHRRDGDFFFLRADREQQLQELIVDLVARRLPQSMGIPAGEIQVLTPTRKGPLGTWELNRLLQARLNPSAPGKKEKNFGNIFFREGDRVMQIRNNYDILWKSADGARVGTGIFNGDIATVEAIDPDAETLVLRFDDRIAEYGFDLLGELEPAWALTVHKSQGSEYRCVVLCAWPGSPYLMSRSVLYTAVTRARELLVAAGREDALLAMAENNLRSRRHSGLKARLTAASQA